MSGITLRASLEAVVGKYIRRMERTAAIEAKPVLSANIEDSLLDDLLACYSQPSREALEKKLSGWTHRAIWDIDLKDGKEVRTVRQDVLDDLMAWATGRREQKVWCEHILWHEEFPKGWVYRPSLHSPELWHFCPSCGTPRPKDA